MKIKEILLEIPFLPPSVNTAYSGYYKRHKSHGYKWFLQELKNYFDNLDETFEIKGEKWLQVVYQFYFPLFYKNGKIRKQDVGNFEKVLTDSLSHFIKGFDDEKIKVLFMEKVDSKDIKTKIKISEI